MTQPKTKYVTRKKRLRQLEKKITELEQQIERLTELLDLIHGMLLRSNPRLARSVARDWETINPPPPAPRAKPRLPQRQLPLAPRADLVITRFPGGQHATPRPPKA